MPATAAPIGLERTVLTTPEDCSTTDHTVNLVSLLDVARAVLACGLVKVRSDKGVGEVGAIKDADDEEAKWCVGALDVEEYASTMLGVDEPENGARDNISTELPSRFTADTVTRRGLEGW